MKWIRRIAVYAVFFALLASIPRVLSLPSSPPDGLAAHKYEGYTGVLKLWVCEDWSGGALCAWLNRCLTAFEKAHKGVYVQLTQVSRGTMARYASAQVIPPDALIFSPGMLDGAQGLARLKTDAALRDSLSRMGRTEDGLYALPIALGGYGFAVNRSLLGSLPNDWSAVELPARKNAPAVMNVPADDEAHSWSAALIALLSGTYAGENGAPPRAGEGLDFGLPTATPAAQATEPPPLLENALPCELPADFRQRESVYAAFTKGQAAAIPVTQREIHRLALLADQGKAPDYLVAASGEAFTDQAALFAINDAERPDRQARVELCRVLLEQLLSDEMQQKLTIARAFRTTDGAPLYPAQSEMGILEAHLSQPDLLAAPAFSNSWRQEARALCDRMQAGELTPREAMSTLKERLS